MAVYRFTRSAYADLIDIWLYGAATWGEAQADRHQDALHGCCARLASGELPARRVPGVDAVRAHRCGSHILFFVERYETLIVIAALHERMDILRRLRSRLGVV